MGVDLRVTVTVFDDVPEVPDNVDMFRLSCVAGLLQAPCGCG